MYTFRKKDFFKLYTLFRIRRFFNAKLNGAQKAVSNIFFISDKIMSRYSTEYIKKNSERLEEDILNRSGVKFHNFAFQELNDVAKYGCEKVQLSCTSRYAKEILGK